MSLASLTACPDCPPAREARAMVLGEGQWINVLYAVLPFVVVVLAVWWFVARIERGIRP